MIREKYSYYKSALVAISVILFNTGCFHRLVPVSHVGKYEATSNETIYDVAPYGGVSLPGKWESGKYSKATRRQYFYREDTTTMVVTLGPCSQYPFSGEAATGYEFVQKYYEMEKSYQSGMSEQATQILASDSTSGYVLWKLHEDGIDQYYLCGVKRSGSEDCAYKVLTLKNRRIPQSQAVAMLKDIYTNSR